MKIFIQLYRDSLSSYGHWESLSQKVHEDENGKYQIKSITKEVPCNCHPETCFHFDGKKTISYTEKIPIKA